MRRSDKEVSDFRQWRVIDDLACGCPVTAAELKAVEACRSCMPCSRTT